MNFSGIISCLVQLALLCLFQSTVHGLTLGSRISYDLGLVEDDYYQPVNSSLELFGRQADRPEWLRILSLGASIVRGTSFRGDMSKRSSSHSKQDL